MGKFLCYPFTEKGTRLRAFQSLGQGHTASHQSAGIGCHVCPRHSPCSAFPRPAQGPGQAQSHFLKSFWSPLQPIGPESGADWCHLALRRRWQQRHLPDSGPPSWAPASAESSFMKQLSRAGQGSVGAVGPRAPGTRLVGLPGPWQDVALGRTLPEQTGAWDREHR